MGVLELLKERREDIIRLAKKHGADNVRVFGSAVRGSFGEDSDIDFLVSVPGTASPWFPVELIEDLEAALGRKVDVVTEDGVYWLLRRRILKEAVPL